VGPKVGEDSKFRDRQSVMVVLRVRGSSSPRSTMLVELRGLGTSSSVVLGYRQHLFASLECGFEIPLGCECGFEIWEAVQICYGQSRLASPSGRLSLKYVLIL
jgi:hypothetical protein